MSAPSSSSAEPFTTSTRLLFQCPQLFPILVRFPPADSARMTTKLISATPSEMSSPGASSLFLSVTLKSNSSTPIPTWAAGVVAATRGHAAPENQLLTIRSILTPSGLRSLFLAGAPVPTSQIATAPLMCAVRLVRTASPLTLETTTRPPTSHLGCLAVTQEPPS